MPVTGVEVAARYAPLVAFVLGLVAGSFCNVVVYRVPLGGSVMRPRSFCPSCGRTIRWFDNIPVGSFLALGGRCRNCRVRISIRYPLVELGVGAMWALTAARIGLKPELPAFLVFGAALVILSVIDLTYYRLPNRVLAPAAGIGVLALITAAFVSGRWDRLGGAALGAAAYGLILLGISIAVPGGMGMGDVKLAGYVGAHLGWFSLMHVVLGGLLAVLWAGAVASALLVSGKRGRKSAIPFGPFIAAGALAAATFGDPMLRLWLG